MAKRAMENAAALPLSRGPRWTQLLLLLLLLILQLSLLVAHVSSSPADRLRGRMAIVNGQQVVDQRYLAYQVAIFHEGDYICGGSIITPSYILTAAHCFLARQLSEYLETNDSSVFDRKYHKFDTDPKAKRNYCEIAYGASDHNSTAVKKVRVAEGWTHKDFILEAEFLKGNGSLRLRISNDVAILRLATALTYSESVCSIPLSPDDSYLQPGHDLTASGWGGMVTDGGPYPTKLQVVTLDNMDDICRATLRNEGYTFLPEQNFTWWYSEKEVICAGCPQGGSGICGGDSGGPLSVMPATNGCPVQVGVVQSGFLINSTTCTMAGPDHYARLSSYLDWIEYMVKQPLRSTIAPVPTQQCENCLGNDHPTGEECERAQKYDLKVCEMQARLAHSFVLEKPTCKAGHHKLKAHMEFDKGFADAAFQSLADLMQELKKGHVVFFLTEKGPGNGVMYTSTGLDDFFDRDHPSLHATGMQITTVNTPLQEPRLASGPVYFNSQEEGWSHLVPGCSPNHTYAALYVLLPDDAAEHTYYQISIPVGRVPEP